MIAEAVVSACILVGAGFAFTGALGLLRLPDFFSRLHGPTKATTLGVGSLVLASVLYFALFQGDLGLRELLVALFLFLTAPVSAHLMARAGLHVAVDSVTGEPDEPRTHLAAYREEGREDAEAGSGEAREAPEEG